MQPRTGHTIAGFLCVLASGSRGNCSVLCAGSIDDGPLWLIDLGLSMRMTRSRFDALGLDFSRVRGILLTHADSDHLYSGWANSLPQSAPIYAHEHHHRRMSAMGFGAHQIRPVQRMFELDDGVGVHTKLLSHDASGVVSYRITMGGAEIGFATDVGRITGGLIDHLKDVDVLAVESNYCPCLQAASDRPKFLKERITGGSGHLSNEECARAAGLIGPREHVVLLHLSQECNTPELALAGHGGRGYRVTVSSQRASTEWVEIRRSGGDEGAHVTTMGRQQTLFSRGPG